MNLCRDSLTAVLCGGQLSACSLYTDSLSEKEENITVGI